MFKMVFMCNPPTEEEEMVTIKTTKEIELDKFEFIIDREGDELVRSHHKAEIYESFRWALVEEQKIIFDNKTQSFPIKFTYKEWIKFRKQLFGE